MKGFIVFFLAVAIISVPGASGRIQSMWDYHREHDTSVIPESRIIQGTPAMDGDFPYQVRISMYGGILLLGWCGGSIIAPNWVLTAGHCASYDIPITILDYIIFYVEAGSVKANQPSQETYVFFTDAYPHPDFNLKTVLNDIALLKTDEAFDFSGTLVKPIKLVAANTDPNTYVGKLITVAGFGATSNGGLISGVLRYTKDLKVITSTECQIEYEGKYDPIPRTSFCAKDTTPPISAVCSGDSGGSATMVINGQLVQIGIISYAFVPNCDNAAQGFTNVSEFIPWILSITGPL